MDRLYLNAREIVDLAKIKLESIGEQVDIEGLENNTAYFSLLNLVDKLEDFSYEINYLSSPFKEGILRATDHGKFYIFYDDETESYPLSCSSSLEVLVDDLWQIGRVEYRSEDDYEGYYFYGEDKPFLHSGMRVRKRIDWLHKRDSYFKINRAISFIFFHINNSFN